MRTPTGAPVASVGACSAQRGWAAGGCGALLAVAFGLECKSWMLCRGLSLGAGFGFAVGCMGLLRFTVGILIERPFY